VIGFSVILSHEGRERAREDSATNANASIGMVHEAVAGWHWFVTGLVDAALRRESAK
jgi:hypothetical protein